MPQESRNMNGYSPGHPWYYVLGGKVLSPKSILKSVQARSYRGYMAEAISKVDDKPEPQRSESLRSIKAKVIDDLRNDLKKYRDCARNLAAFRKGFGSSGCASICESIHISISLKHNHIFNDFAHLILLDEYLSKQPDLFG